MGEFWRPTDSVAVNTADAADAADVADAADADGDGVLSSSEAATLSTENDVRARVRPCTEEEIEAEKQRAAEEQRRALAEAEEAHTIELEWIGSEDKNEYGDLMGSYTLVKGKVV